MVISVGLLSLLTMFITQVVKNYIEPKFGKNGVMVSVFIVALIAAALYEGKILDYVVVQQMLVVAGLAVGWYEILMKRIYGTMKKSVEKTITNK